MELGLKPQSNPLSAVEPRGNAALRHYGDYLSKNQPRCWKIWEEAPKCPKKQCMEVPCLLAFLLIPLHVSLTVSISNTPWQDPLDIDSVFFPGELLDAADHLNTWGRRNARGTKARTRQIWDLRLVVNRFCGRSCVPPVLHPRQKQDEAADAAQRPETSDNTCSVLQ